MQFKQGFQLKAIMAETNRDINGIKTGLL